MADIVIPNPGSNEALDLGCKCPVLDNAHGKGAWGSTDKFWINGDCLLHSNQMTKEVVEDAAEEMAKTGRQDILAILTHKLDNGFYKSE